MSAESSVDLLERAQAGDRAALDAPVARYLPRLRRSASGRLPRWARDRADTQDLVRMWWRREYSDRASLRSGTRRSTLQGTRPPHWNASAQISGGPTRGTIAMNWFLASGISSTTRRSVRNDPSETTAGGSNAFRRDTRSTRSRGQDASVPDRAARRQESVR